ncbi:MAG: hypothetical protein HN948_07555 [Clostridia bacterium]|jgi:hypothetical protein|nr:hypothetical protein [Clostridia bacterium]MBT7122850.1 hypothetical protein [Clostridia bacterium]
MKYILAIDDTDNLESVGTGEQLENIIVVLEKEHGCSCARVTRHQLFFSPRIRYTSHNSAMSTIVTTDALAVQVFNAVCDYLLENAAEGSDPGACLFDVDKVKAGEIATLERYGQRCKTEYVHKHEARQIAGELGIMLRELGGEGIGVIGALAGAALRLNGSDGRYKGNFELGVNHDNMLCRDILSHPYVDAVMSEGGEQISPDTQVFITQRIKTVNLDNKSVLLVKRQKTKDGEVFVNLSKAELKKY